MWSSTGALPCKVFNPENGTLANVDTSKTSESLTEEECVPSSLLQHASRGRPLINIQEVLVNEDTTSTDTDLDSELVADKITKLSQEKTSRKASP